MFRQSLIKRYDIQENAHMITHHRSVYLSPFFDLFIILLVVYVIWYFLDYFTKNQILTTIAAILGVVIYLKTLIDFFNLYLDAMVISEGGVTIYRRKSLTHYETEHFVREKIEAMNHTQNSWSDRLFDKGDLRVLLEHGTTYRFTNVARPTHHSEVFLAHRQKNIHPHEFERYESTDDRFNILIEAMGEVVRDYMDEKAKNDTPTQQDLGRRK